MRFICALAGALVLLMLLVAMPVAANGQSGTTLSATVDVTPHWTTTYGWTIDKSASPDTLDMFCGDSGTVTYTITVTKDAGTTEAWVDGQICVTNGGAVATEDLAITVDVVKLGGPAPPILASATVDVSGNPVLDPGESGCYNYRIDIPSPIAGATYKVTAHITITNHSGHLGEAFGPDPSATTVWPASPTLINDAINVDDTNGGSWLFTDGGSVSYDRTFTCCGDTGTHENTATIRETGQSDPASVTVTCYELEITKDASTSFDRTYLWTIGKSADQSTLTLSKGQQYLINYVVTVDTNGYTDSNWAADGTITVHNPAPIGATITGISDIVSPDIAATVDFSSVTFPYTLAAGGDLIGTYRASLPDATARTNTATATLQNYGYSPDGSSTATGSTDFSGTADVDFSTATMTEYDECIDVSDTYAGDLGTICLGDAPKTFTYSRWIGPYDTCGEYTVENTATFTGQDPGATGSASRTVNVNVPCAGGCTLTPGYWKTHSEKGPAPYDDTWAQLPGGADTSFYSSGTTYYQVLWTPPAGGNSYYILSSQYIAAQLNVLNGASTPPDIVPAMSFADTFFNTYTPATAGAWKGNSAMRKQAIAYASVLSDYNSGLIGPGHCSE